MVPHDREQPFWKIADNSNGMEKRIQSAHVYPARGDLTERTVTILQATFAPKELEVVDIHKDSELLKALERKATPCGLKYCATGFKAAELFQIPGFSNADFIGGGIYFSAIPRTDAMASFNLETPQGAGFVFYNPKQNGGAVLSHDVDRFTMGGYLTFAHSGKANLLRKKEFHVNEEEKAFCSDTLCEPLNQYRLVVQSNLVLVADGIEDQNNDKVLAARAALSADANGYISYVIAYEPNQNTLGRGVTLKEFGDLLVELGSQFAVNLDGGPSVQMALKGINKAPPVDAVKRNPKEKANPMPQFFVVRKN